MIEFEIDGKKLTAEQGKMIIEVADNAGIYIPRFCYHKKLSIAANCRMCLVDVEKAPKSLPACATPVTAGMKVFTKSEKTLAAQRSVMEFLLINHPLDCPICDQGGECELQDISMGYGSGHSRYRLGKRSVEDKNLGPLIASEMTRCIQCTRCVRFGEEVAGMRELGAYNRGEHLEIGTYIQRTIKSEVSGNIIDICPVGALTSKPYRFVARAWEMIQHPSIAPHDCIGSNIFVHTRGEEYSKVREVMRVVPRANEAINEVWLADRDRFSYEALNSADRVLTPKIKQGDVWQEVDWVTALDFVAKTLQKITKEHGAKQIAGLASPNSTLEEFYLLQKLMRGLGSNNIDHRLHQTDFSDQIQAPAYPNLGISLEDLEQRDAILLVGSDVRREQPLGCQRIRKAWLQDASIMCVNSIDYAFNFDVRENVIVGVQELPQTLAKIAKALNATETALANVEPGKKEQAIANKLKKAERPAIILGAQALNHPQAAIIRTLVNIIARQINSTYGCFTDGANSAGAWLAGAVPHREAAGKTIAKPGSDVQAMFAKSLRAYLLLNVEPELDCADSAAAMAALNQAELVVALSPFMNPAMEKYARVHLPIAPFTETAGTFINIEGRWQSFAAAALPPGEVRPAWKVLRVLGNLLQLSGFDYVSTQAIHDELQKLIAAMPSSAATRDELTLTSSNNQKLTRIAEWPMYRSDNLVRRSQPLQQALDADIATIRINAALAKALQFKDGQLVKAIQNNSQITLPLKIDARIADNTVFIPAGLTETAGFGAAFAVIELRGADHA